MIAPSVCGFDAAVLREFQRCYILTLCYFPLSYLGIFSLFMFICGWAIHYFILQMAYRYVRTSTWCLRMWWRNLSAENNSEDACILVHFLYLFLSLIWKALNIIQRLQTMHLKHAFIRKQYNVQFRNIDRFN